MQQKMFWIIFTILSLLADFTFSFMWGLILTIPILILSWWMAYRSGWFD